MLHGPVRVPWTVGEGEARVTISLDDWREGHVRPATLSMPVLPAVSAPAHEAWVSNEPVLDGRLRTTLKTATNTLAFSLAFSPDSSILAAAPSLQWWDIKTGKERMPLEGGAPWTPWGVAFWQDGRTLATAHGENRKVQVQEKGKSVQRMEFEGDVRVWDVATGKLCETLGHTQNRSLRQVAFCLDGQALATYGYGPGMQAEVCVWDRSTSKPRTVLPVAGGGAGFAPNGKLFATEGEEVRLWDTAMGKPVAILPTGDRFSPVRSWAFTPDSRTLAGGTIQSGLVYIWDVASHSRRAILYHGDQARVVRGLAFAPDGKTLAVGLFPQSKRPSGTTEPSPRAQIVLWDTASYKQRGILDVPAPAVGSLAFSPDGQLLAASVTGSILLWDVSGLPAGK